MQLNPCVKLYLWIFKIINYGCYYGQRTHVHKHTPGHSNRGKGYGRVMWSDLSLCKQKEQREDKVQRGYPLFKCQAVLVVLSLLFLFPLFCPSQGSDSPPSPLLRCLLLCVRACGRDYVGVHVPARGAHSWSWSCVRERWHGPVLFLRHQNLPTGEKKNERRMQAGMKRWQQLQGVADGKT